MGVILCVTLFLRGDFMSADKKKLKPRYNMWQNSAYMAALAWRHKKSVLFLCVALAVLAVGNNLLGLFIAPVILQAVEDSAELPELVRLILLFTGGILIISAIIAYIDSNALFGRISLRSRLVNLNIKKLVTTSYPNTENRDFHKKSESSAMSLKSNTSAGEAVWTTFTDILRNILGFIIYLLILAVLEPWIVVVVLGTTLLSFLITNHINGWGYRHRDEVADYSQRLYYATNIGRRADLAKDIRIFNMKPWIDDIFRASMALMDSFAIRRERVYIWGNVADVVLSLARNGIAYIYLIHLTVNQDLPVALFLLYFTAVGGFAAWVSGILKGFTDLRKNSLDLSATREFFEYPEMFRFEDGKPLAPDKNTDYELELRNVSFRYHGADKDALSCVNLKINPGEKLAIVGMNGAGKTTLVKLLCGMYDPTHGQVLLNGQDITIYNRRDYYRHFSAVFQDFSILGMSIADNIAQGGEIATSKLEAIVELAGLTNKINNLPARFDTSITKDIYEDGIELSGGETQRLMLARALYKDAPIIILDEPTASLDPIAEADLYSKYNDLTKGRTALYISHRLASTRFCDRIILIDEGGILEEGSHEKLLSQGGKYAELYDIQSHYYKEGDFDEHRQSAKS